MVGGCQGRRETLYWSKIRDNTPAESNIVTVAAIPTSAGQQGTSSNSISGLRCGMWPI